MIGKTEKLIEKIEKYLQKEYDKGHKFNLKKPNQKSVFLPHIQDFSTFVGYSKPFAKLASSDAFDSSSPNAVSQTNLYKLYKEGIGFRVAKKLLRWFFSLPIPVIELMPMKLMIQAHKASKLRSHAGEWLSNIHSFKVGLKHHEVAEPHEYLPIFHFIENRCKSDVAFLTTATKQLKKQGKDLRSIHLLIEQQNALLRKHTLVPERFIDDELTKMAQETNLDVFDSVTKRRLTQAYLHQFFDFYLHLVASFEAGCSLMIKSNESVFDAKPQGMIVTRALNTFTTDPHMKNVFDAFLVELSRPFSDNGEQTALKKLSTCIPMNEAPDKELCESLPDKQYSKLKQWRSLKHFPSDEILIAFLNNASKELGKEFHLISFALAKSCIALTKAEQSLNHFVDLGICTDEELSSDIRQVMSRYPVYFEHHFSYHVESYRS
ncbi:MAG: hypothetical protein HAW67_02770 [Endozoicomonadaceae bacterium]|nr:hypothetical protein [Endozoicomonadaceae bacterium]